ncbi:MAG: hypothetical protein HYT22_02790 [Candidatus Niyogibacteria bacterium]|nr:hypothetical protein [Candidatus Niyogibacteria bacterium]
MMRRRSFSFAGFFCVIAIATTALFFFGPAVERPTAAFLFSKIRYMAGALAFGSSWVWGRSEGASPLPPAGNESAVAFPERAAVIFRPPSIPYDQIIIDRGERDGIRTGMSVVAPYRQASAIDGETSALLRKQNAVSAVDEIFIGWVSDVFWDSSRVVSPTSFGRETDVVLEGSETVAAAVGAGNRELRIRLPRDFPVTIGDRIFSVGSRRQIIGVVAEIAGETSSAIKEARIRQPVNERTLRFVYVIE